MATKPGPNATAAEWAGYVAELEGDYARGITQANKETKVLQGYVNWINQRPDLLAAIKHHAQHGRLPAPVGAETENADPDVQLRQALDTIGKLSTNVDALQTEVKHLRGTAGGVKLGMEQERVRKLYPGVTEKDFEAVEDQIDAHGIWKDYQSTFEAVHRSRLEGLTKPAEAETSKDKFAAQKPLAGERPPTEEPEFKSTGNDFLDAHLATQAAEKEYYEEMRSGRGER